MSNRILIFLENFLPASQAFVTQQARAIRNREIAFLVSRRIPSPLEGLDRFTVHEMRASLKGQTAELLLKGPMTDGQRNRMSASQSHLFTN